MRVGKTIRVVTSPKRRVRKANEPHIPQIEEPIPVDIPGKKKIKREVEASSVFKYSYRLSWGAMVVSRNPYILTSVV